MNIIKDSFKVIIISSVISLSALFVFAQTNWFEPGVAPPGDNRPAPLTLDSQGNLDIPGSITANEYYVDQTPFTDLSDLDGDGYTPKQGDCDDEDSSIKPGGILKYDSGKDGDCTGIKEFTRILYDADVPDLAGAYSTANYYCSQKVENSTAVQRALQFQNRDGGWGGSSCLLNSKTIICLTNHWGGTSGNIGSCGGHGECANSICELQEPYDYDSGREGECLEYKPARWFIWCN